MILTLVLLVVVLAMAGGVWGGPRYGYHASWSPLAVVIVVVLCLYLTGYLR